MRYVQSAWVPWFVVTAFIAAVLGASVLMLAVGRERIRQGNCDRIQGGMTREEVEALLGQPPDAAVVLQGRVRGAHWRSDYGAIIRVEFDAQERVCGKEFTASPPWARVRRVVGRLLPW